MRAKWYLVRHGETDWNVRKRAQGSTDTPLNEKGHVQADFLGKRLGVNALLSSLWQRPDPRRRYGVCDPEGPEHHLATTSGVAGKVLRRMGRYQQ